MPVGRKFSSSSTISSTCAFCGLLENEMHCFVRCDRLTPVWRWLFCTISNVCPWVLNITDEEKLFGYSIHCLHNDLNVQIWKVLHAETIRVIWYSRCSKVFDRESLGIEAMKGMIRYRVQSTYSIYAASPKASRAQIQAWLNAFPCSPPQALGRSKLHIPL
jgi:hypothetical protein